MATTTHHPDDANSWRDLADQLADDQRARLEDLDRFAAAEGLPGAGTPQYLLELARTDASRNLTDRVSFGDVPMPSGAVSAEHWSQVDGAWTRHFEGEHRGVGLDRVGLTTGRVVVYVDGVQHVDGSAERTVWLGLDNDGAELTAAEARQLAAALTATADEIESLE